MEEGNEWELGLVYKRRKNSFLSKFKLKKK